jgi:hypothetical protein
MHKRDELVAALRQEAQQALADKPS